MNGDKLALVAVAALAAIGAARRGSQNWKPRLDLKVDWLGKNLRVRYMGEKTDYEGIGWVTSYGAVGGVNLESIPTIKLCADDLETMRASLPDVKVMIVTSAYLEEDLRGNGLGKKMYEVALAEAAKKGYAVAPEYCWHASMTSPDAKRVWASLKRRYFSVGDLVWGGRPPASHNHHGETHDVVLYQENPVATKLMESL
jgi:predicted GNAT family acetyltransferase